MMKLACHPERACMCRETVACVFRSLENDSCLFASGFVCTKCPHQDLKFVDIFCVKMNVRIGPRSPERGGLSPQRCGEKAIRTNGPMNQTVSQCMMGNYIHCMKRPSVCFAHASQNESWINLQQR